MNNWAADLLDKFSSRKAILVSHYLIGFNKIAGTNLGGEATFGKQGQRIYDRLKTKPNLFMMICGHVGDNGEGYRQDTYSGKTVKTFLADYQSRPRGGDGIMRLMTFNPEKDLITVRTLSPFHHTSETDDDSEFTKPWFRETAASRIFDFNNDGKTDAAFFDNGSWTIGNNAPVTFGKAGDIPVPGDYTGDGKADMCMYRPSTGEWLVYGAKEKMRLGQKGDIPVPGDYDGSGKLQPTVYNESSKTIRTLSGMEISVAEGKGRLVNLPYKSL